jgi:hypothetical protein
MDSDKINGMEFHLFWNISEFISNQAFNLTFFPSGAPALKIFHNILFNIKCKHPFLLVFVTTGNPLMNMRARRVKFSQNGKIKPNNLVMFPFQLICDLTTVITTVNTTENTTVNKKGANSILSSD